MERIQTVRVMILLFLIHIDIVNQANMILSKISMPTDDLKMHSLFFGGNGDAENSGATVFKGFHLFS